MIKNKIVRDTLLLTVMQLLLDTASLFMNAFITRRLGAEAIGILSLMGSFLGLAGIVSNGNAFLCTSRLISEETGRKNGSPEGVLAHGIKLCLLLSGTVSAVLVFSAEPLSSRFFSGADMAASVRLMPAALIAGAVSACLKGYFNAMRRAGIAAAADIVDFAVRSAVIMTMTLAVGACSEGDICRTLIISIISGNTASLLFLAAAFLKLRSPSSGRSTLTMRDYAKLAFPIMGGGLLTAVLSSTNDALIPACLRQYGDSTADALSLFGIFEAIVIPALFFPSVVLCSVSGLIVSESARASAGGNSGRIRSMTAKIVEYTMLYSVFASAVLMRFGGMIGVVMGGGELGGSMIRYIAPVVPFIYMEIVLEAMIKGMGMQSFSSLNYLAEYVIRISAVLILVPRIGFYGIAVSYYASNIFGNVMRLVKVLRAGGVPLRPVRTVLLPGAYAFLTLNGAELLVRTFGTGCNLLTEAIAVLTVWIMLYGAIIILRVNNKTKKPNSNVFDVQNKQLYT